MRKIQADKNSIPNKLNIKRNNKIKFNHIKIKIKNKLEKIKKIKLKDKKIKIPSQLGLSILFNQRTK
jgi:hypothetical protein